MREVSVGQVLSLKIRFNNENLISPRKHPYLIVDVNDNLGYVEIAQLDSLEGKEFKAARVSNKIIYADDPIETAIDKDSYIQLDNTFKVELFQGISQFRRQKDTLSEKKLADVIAAYYKYHEDNAIDENKIVYMDREEILSLNK